MAKRGSRHSLNAAKRQYKYAKKQELRQGMIEFQQKKWDMEFKTKYQDDYTEFKK